MSINLRGHILNQRQLDAITPVMNDLIQGRIGQKKFEQACVDALEKAGCPLGYDTGIDSGKSLEQRAQDWIVNGRVGLSSKAIWSHMTGTPMKDDGFGAYLAPSDPADLNRCLLLLDLIPEWKPRMHEMAEHGPEWTGLIARWDEIVECFLDEVGLNWCKGKEIRATRTYALMKQARGAA